MKKAVFCFAPVLLTAFTVLTLTSHADNRSTSGNSVERRLAIVEKKLTNLERLFEIRLDDDAAIQRALNEREQMKRKALGMTLMSQLRTVRSQMELYQVQHHGNYPEIHRSWAQLTRKTNFDGDIISSNSTASRRLSCGPYLQTPPVNPFTKSSIVVTSMKKVSGKVGWFYIPKTGELRAVVPKSAVDEHKFNLSDVVTY